jgi:demethylmenaquinone methyltransferase/2-methoxy-6-polyprenyl-1,4-benzoquinol methylase
MGLSASELSELLSEQVAYYRARAPEYDDWWTQSGRYHQGPDASSRFAAEVAELYDALDRFQPSEDVLELACGTGIWTERLVRTAASLTCVDAAPEMIEINRERLTSAGVPLPRYMTADIFEWAPSERYDVVFFGFWLSHIPTARLRAFWEKARSALKPRGRVFFVTKWPRRLTTIPRQTRKTANAVR